MFNLVLVFSVAVPILALAFDIRRKPMRQIVLSHFWYFTLIWLAAFPLRGWLVLNHDRASQLIMTRAALRPDEIAMAVALAVALVYWAAAYLGFHTPSSTQPKPNLKSGLTVSTSRVVAVGLFWMVLAVGATAYLDLLASDIDGPQYLRSRMGAGLIWMLPELCIPAFIAFLAFVAIRPGVLDRKLLTLIIAGGVFVALWLTIELSSRRIIAAVLLGLVVTLVVRRSRMWPLGGFVMVGSVVGAGLFELVRYLPMAVRNAISLDKGIWISSKQILQSVFIDNPVLFLSTSFEGADHVSTFLQRTSSWQLWTGVDHGISWLFNLGLSYLPRAIWHGKPIIYGGLEQMAWLYPSYLVDGIPTTAIPTSFVVDFAFGFGLPFGLVLAFLLGRYLRVCETVLVNRNAHPATFGFSLITFIFMFNVVRGGTAIGQMLIVFAVIAASMLGLRATIGAIWQFVAETLGILAKAVEPVPDKVFFYPHNYLRDRQLDTIRWWPADKAVNRELADGRQGAQVSRDQALAENRRSWKQALPLLNVKRRPVGAPEDSAVYIWGGLVTSGSFIVDLDNPYAFTGYNVTATRLYRPVISWILAGPRCLSVRCLSRACLEGVRELYGEAVAEKAVVAYPVIAPKVAAPPSGGDGECRFLFVATQFEIKGGAALLAAFRRVVAVYPGATLDMVTHLPPEFSELAASCPGVKIHGADFSRGQIAERFLAQADVLVHPTYCDSFGMVVLEAMAHGLPVIATRVYAIPEMVEDGENGGLLDPPVSIWDGIRPGPLFPDTSKVRAAARITDTTALEEGLESAMLALARDPARRRIAGEAALNRAVEWSRRWPTE